MDRDLDVLMVLLLDPCLTADEAAREATARIQTAWASERARTEPAARGRKAHRPEAADTDGPAVGF